jgi:hypothetical protein
MFFRNVGSYKSYTSLHPRRRHSSDSKGSPTINRRICGLDQWLRDSGEWMGPSHRLMTGTGPVSATACFLVIKNYERWTKSKNPMVPLDDVKNSKAFSICFSSGSILWRVSHIHTCHLSACSRNSSTITSTPNSLVLLCSMPASCDHPLRLCTCVTAMMVQEQNSADFST